MDDQEPLVFLDEESPLPRSGNDMNLSSWRVLVVDDDEDVHETTRMAMDGVPVLGRPIEFLHAYSGAEALEVLRRERDIAAILLDVVMETVDAGLRVVGTLRDELDLHNVRVILRTGQPGQAPEMETITRYDIDDYKTKTELTRNKLFTTLTTAMRSFERLRQLDASRRGLEKIISASNQFIAQQGLQSFAEGVITQIAALIGIEPEGLVCAAIDERESFTEEGSLRVIAAAGQYRTLIEHDLSEITDARIVSSLSRCLHERRSIIGTHSATLCFEVKESRALAAFIDSKTAIQDIDRYLLEIFCTNIALCADNVHLVESLHKQAYMDPLIGLPNRTALIEMLDAKLSEPERDDLSLAVVDVDHFSATNDMLGHRHGDELLRAIGGRLSESFPDCTIARVAGDVFGLLGPTAALSAVSIRGAFSSPYHINHVNQTVSASVGIARLSEMAGGGSDGVKNAYIALKRAKTNGYGQVAFYSPEFAAKTRERARLLQDLRLAFDNNRLFAVYQPQMDLCSGKVVGFEALMRWRTSEGRLIPPDQFIPVAEHSGLIVPLGAWILRTSLETLRTLHRSGYPDLRMAVNVSTVQLRQQDFLSQVDDALQKIGMNPAHLELEITESSASLGVNKVAELVNAIRQRGIAVAIDDFGTGFSSLSYLDRLPVTRLKIDRSFVQALDTDLPGERIAEMVVPLGHRLGLRVLAEGVENEAQAKALRALACDEVQGYLYSPPIPGEDLLAWLAENSH